MRARESIPSAHVRAVADLRECLQLFRLYRIKNMILNLQEAFPRSVVYVTGFQLLLYFSLGAHWCACIFFALTLGLGDPTSEDPYVQHLFFNGWALGDGFLDENAQHVQYTADPWLSSLYWAVCNSTVLLSSVFARVRAVASLCRLGPRETGMSTERVILCVQSID